MFPCSPVFVIRRSSHSRVNSWCSISSWLMSFSHTDVKTSRGDRLPSVWTRIKSSGTLGWPTSERRSATNERHTFERPRTLVSCHVDVGMHFEMLRQQVAQSVILFPQDKVRGIGHPWQTVRRERDTSTATVTYPSTHFPRSAFLHH